MPDVTTITAEKFKEKQKDISFEERIAITNLSTGFNSIVKKDSSLLKEDSRLDKFCQSLAVLINPISSLEQIKNALENLTGLPNYLKDGDEFNTNYHIIKHDGEKDYSLEADKLDDGLKTLEKLTGIKFDKTAIEDAQRDKLISAEEKNIDPATKISRPVVENEVISLEGIQEVAKIGKNFFDPTSSEYTAVSNLQEEMRNASQKLYNWDIKDASENNELDNDELDHGELTNKKTKKFTLEENKKLKEKIDEFVNSVETIKKAGNKENNISREDAEKALDNVKNFPIFLQGGFKTTFYNRLKNNGLNIYQFSTGMNTLEKSLKLGINVENVEKAEARVNKTFAADKSIEATQAEMRKNKRALMTDSDLLKQRITSIMATRMAVNSILGDGSSLNVKTNSMEKFDAEQKLLGNKHFQDFLSAIVTDPKKVKVAISVATSGHGGGLDKMFTAYLKTRPAGELQNDPEIDRFMPTVKSRIEFLQTQAAEHYRKDQTAPVKEIAEIVGLREISNMASTNRPNLKGKIPTYTSLSDKVNERTNNAQFIGKCGTRAVLDFVRKGHGGEMQKNINMSHPAQPEAALKKGGLVM